MANELMERTITYMVNGEEVRLNGNMVRDYLVNGDAKVTDQEVVMFLNLCKYQKLNPFLKEAYLIKYGTKAAQLVVSKEAYMKRAYSAPNFERIRAGIIVQRNGELLELEGSFYAPKDVILGGWAEVYIKGIEKAYITTKITMQEFNKNQATWKEMPATMIRKTAMVQALREAFPTELGAMYTEEETSNLQASTVEQTDRELRQEKQQKANREVIDIDPVFVQEEPEPVQEPAPVREELAGQTKMSAPF